MQSDDGVAFIGRVAQIAPRGKNWTEGILPQSAFVYDAASDSYRCPAGDTKTGIEKVVDLSSAVDVSDEAVEAMIGDSLEHAFEDMSERVWTETRLKAEEMLAAIEQALPLAGDRLAVEERDRIKKIANDVREAMQTHETPRLKTANTALDDATQGLAALIVEQAMAGSAGKTEG